MTDHASQIGNNIFYRIGACGLSNTYKRCFDFAIIRFLKKLFKSNRKLFIEECLVNFNFKPPSQLFNLCCKSFSTKFCD
jgi:hypothetical protein